jgi:DNA-binding MarR family transcriptional regulator
MPERDAVDSMLDQWRRERPDLPLDSMAVMGRVSRLEALLMAELEPILRAHGLNGADLDVLAALRRAGEPFSLTPTELSRSLMVGSGTVSHRLERLERRGLLRRRASRDDRRSVRVELTQRGRRVVDAAVSELVETEARLLRGLPAREREQLERLLRRLLASLEPPPPT